MHASISGVVPCDSWKQAHTLPLPHTLLPLHPPTHSTLHPNPWNCDNNISVLFQLVHSGIVTDGNQLRCTNGTLIRDLDIEIEGMTTLTSLTHLYSSLINWL